jgi:polyphosphate glucokinase
MLVPAQLAEEAQKLTGDWNYKQISIGYPGVVREGSIIVDPRNLGTGWVAFDFAKAFGCPTKIINDAAMQALGGYRNGCMLFLGLGTGLGSALIVDGIVKQLEFGQLPYKEGICEDYVGEEALKRVGTSQWAAQVHDIIRVLSAAIGPDEILLGGGNIRLLEQLPPDCRAGDNADALTGGIRLWDEGLRVY